MRPTFCTLATVSLALNLAAGWQYYQSHALVDAHCRKLDRYACAMRPTVISFALEAEPPKAMAGTDPIGDLIQSATAHGYPVPPAQR